jgi:O-glycosyl hydrolase
MQQAESAFDGVSFHCYQGSVSDQASFTSQYPNKVFIWAFGQFFPQRLVV